MSDLISIKEAINKIDERGCEMFTLDSTYFVYLRALQDVEHDLRSMPTIDAVPVVRCIECKYRDTINCGMQFYGYDDDGHLCKSDDWTQDDGFCYWGERKDV